jgi:hypothetical protein
MCLLFLAGLQLIPQTRSFKIATTKDINEDAAFVHKGTHLDFEKCRNSHREYENTISNL